MDLLALLRDAGLRSEAVTDLNTVCQQAMDLHAAGKLRALVGVGGDGTIGELLNRTPAGLPLAMFPRGTENLLAKYLGLKRASVEKMAQTLIEGQTVQIDAGRISTTAPPQDTPTAPGDQQPAEGKVSRLFCLMAGFGFDADVVRRLQAARQGHIHHWSYLKPIFDSLRNYQYPEMQISTFAEPGQRAAEMTARMLFVSNCPAYAGGLPISPQANCADGLLDYCTFRRGSAAMMFKYLTMVATGWHQHDPDVESGTARTIRVEAAEKIPIQIDGDPFGFTPAEITCCPQRMTIFAPREFRLT